MGRFNVSHQPVPGFWCRQVVIVLKVIIMNVEVGVLKQMRALMRNTFAWSIM